MIHALASRRPVLWGTAFALSAALGGQSLMSTPASADRLLDEPSAVSGYTYVTQTSASNSDSARSVSARCPRGKVVLAGGARIVGGGLHVLLRGSYPGHSSSRHEWLATAEEILGGTTAKWSLQAYAVCATKPAGLAYVRAESPFNSNSPKAHAAVCPRGTELIGVGARVRGASHRVGINRMTILSRRSDSARAAEVVGTDRAWAVTAHATCAKSLQQSFRESSVRSVVGPARSGTAFASCPFGSRAYGVGFQTAGSLTTLNRLAPMELRPTQIPLLPALPVGGWATVSELTPWTLNQWSLKAQVICIR